MTCAQIQCAQSRTTRKETKIYKVGTQSGVYYLLWELLKRRTEGTARRVLKYESRHNKHTIQNCSRTI